MLIFLAVVTGLIVGDHIHMRRQLKRHAATIVALDSRVATLESYAEMLLRGEHL